MTRVLLADDSPHAQRMGERILRDEGYEVVTVTDGETALVRLPDADPDLILADVYLPGKSGYEICEIAKRRPRHGHVRVVLLAGLLERVDDAEAARVGADAVLKKPFEASAMLATIKPLIASAQEARGSAKPTVVEEPVEPPKPEPAAAQPPAADVQVDAERVRAAVTVALDRAMPALIDELTEKVLIALGR